MREDRRITSKRYRLKHSEKLRELYRKYCLTHQEQIKEGKKKWSLAHAEQIKEYNKKYRLEHPEKVKKWKEKSYPIHRKHANKVKREWYAEHREEQKKKFSQYMKTPKGRILQRKQRATRKQFGFVPLNKPFKDSAGHHIDRERIIYMPEKLHGSIGHSVLSGRNMERINKIAYEFLGGKYELDRKITMERV